jgi:hypothetical protein
VAIARKLRELHDLRDLPGHKDAQDALFNTVRRSAGLVGDSSVAGCSRAMMIEMTSCVGGVGEGLDGLSRPQMECLSPQCIDHAPESPCPSQRCLPVGSTLVL